MRTYLGQIVGDAGNHVHQRLHCVLGPLLFEVSFIVLQYVQTFGQQLKNEKHNRDLVETILTPEVHETRPYLDCRIARDLMEDERNQEAIGAYYSLDGGTAVI